MPSGKSKSSIIIRAVNYSGEPSSCRLRFARVIKNAYTCNFLEEETGTVSIRSNEAKVTVQPYKMVNIKVGF
jgi:alpha-mannosidase